MSLLDLAPPPDLAGCIEDTRANGETARGMVVCRSPNGRAETTHQSDLSPILIRVSLDRQSFATVTRCDLALITDPA